MMNVHMIGNAHIDPVWLWRWPAGVGEVLATCRTACDLLDEDARLVFTRSDVWVYQQIEEIDPALFRRIQAHVASGRWAVVGGWYIQPDCNLPREESFHRHIESGRRYFLERFGLRVTTGYNVDSFGHAASLPRILADAGYDSYVMMRPMAHEKKLAAALFRWQSTEEAGGVREVLTWRIPLGYCISATDLERHVKGAIAAAAPGVDHVMCFYGVGDHGGGPTREQVDWIRRNESFEGARLLFSHPRRFFDEVKSSTAFLPVVQGELQMHAVGCYSVCRPIKKAARAAEHGLIMAEQALASLGGLGALAAPGAPGAGAGPGAAARLDAAWEKLMFNQFHDTYGGTAIPAACDDAVAQLGAARDDADRVLHTALFRYATSLPPCDYQQVVALNASDAPFDGFIEWEPWLGDWKKFDGWLADASGAPVPYQLLPSPSIANMPGTLLWPARLKPGEVQAWTIRGGNPPAHSGVSPAGLSAEGGSISNGRWKLDASGGGSLRMADMRTGSSLTGSGALRLSVIDDPGDTWSHGIDRYAGEAVGTFVPSGSAVEETGPVRASLRIDTSFNASTATVWARLHANDPRIFLEIRVDWRERLRVLKLEIPLPGMQDERTDGIPGGGAVRPQDGRECPVMDWTLVGLADGAPLGIAIPDCSAMDGGTDVLRFTLLRSPAYAWHDPARLPPGRVHRYLDQGEQTFRCAILPAATAASITALALGMHRPPVCIDWTRGMRAH
jgi:alpha-mannosidase